MQVRSTSISDVIKHEYRVQILSIASNTVLDFLQTQRSAIALTITTYHKQISYKILITVKNKFK